MADEFKDALVIDVTERLKEIFKDGIPVYLTPNTDFVSVVRCKDCKQFRPSTMYKNWGVCLLANDEGYGVCREVRWDSFCSWGERKESEVEE